MNNWIILPIIFFVIMYLINRLLSKETILFNTIFQKNNTTHLDLDHAHNIINHIGLNSSDDQLTSQIKQLFIKNRRVTPDMIQHIATHYNMNPDELYTLIHLIIKQPINC
jgi:hypothetical protein